jgi:hypothetical protein
MSAEFRSVVKEHQVRPQGKTSNSSSPANPGTANGKCAQLTQHQIETTCLRCSKKKWKVCVRGLRVPRMADSHLIARQVGGSRFPGEIVTVTIWPPTAATSESRSRRRKSMRHQTLEMCSRTLEGACSSDVGLDRAAALDDHFGSE